MLELGDSDLDMAVRTLTVCFVSAGLLLAWFLLRAPGRGSSSPGATTPSRARLSGSGCVGSNEVWIVNSSFSVFAQVDI